MILPPLDQAIVEEAVARALREDLGDAGDITTKATVPPDAQAEALLRARQAGIVAGIEAARAAFRQIDERISTEIRPSEDGAYARSIPGSPYTTELRR